MKKGKGKIQTKFNKKRDKKNKGHKKKKKTKKIKSGRPTGNFYKVIKDWNGSKLSIDDVVPKKRNKILILKKDDIIELRSTEIKKLKTCVRGGKKQVIEEDVIGYDQIDFVRKTVDDCISLGDLEWVKMKKKNEVGWVLKSIFKTHMKEEKTKKSKKKEAKKAKKEAKKTKKSQSGDESEQYFSAEDSLSDKKSKKKKKKKSEQYFSAEEPPTPYKITKKEAQKKAHEKKYRKGKYGLPNYTGEEQPTSQRLLPTRYR